MGNTQSQSKTPKRSPSLLITEEKPPQGRGPIFRCPLNNGQLLKNIQDDDGTIYQTAHEIFLRGVKKFPNHKMHGTRPVSEKGLVGPFVFETFSQIYERTKNFAKGLFYLGLIAPNENGMILLGIYMKNRSEWIMSEQAIYMFSGATVPLYDTLGNASTQHILNETKLLTCVCTLAEIPKILKALENSEKRFLKNVIVVDDELPDEAKEDLQKFGISFYLFKEVEAIGREKKDVQFNLAKPKDLATFCYTSGTTSEFPLGALLTHEAMASNISAFVLYFKSCDDFPMINESDVYLSYLPLPHVFERAVQTFLSAFGCSVGFYQGDMLKIIDDLKDLKPTIFAAVPRVINRLYDSVNGKAKEQGGLGFWVFDKAVKTKLKNLTKGQTKHAVYDKLVFGGIKKKLGLENARLLASGGASSSPHVMDFMRILLGCAVVEGYGLTELTCIGTMTGLDETTSGHVGYPAACTEIALFDVPELNYLSTDKFHGEGDGKIPCNGRGEICFRGPTVMREYFQMEEKTKQVIDEDGWLHSGDIGLWTSENQLTLIDRKKNIFKLSQGEYVAPEKVELAISKCDLISQIFVHGDSRASCTVAVAVLNKKNVEKLAKEKGLEMENDFLDSVNFGDVKIFILEKVKKVCKANGLKGFEIPKEMHFTDEPFSVENNFLTPTMKLKRNTVFQHFSKEIKELYKRIEKNENM